MQSMCAAPSTTTKTYSHDDINKKQFTVPDAVVWKTTIKMFFKRLIIARLHNASTIPDLDTYNYKGQGKKLTTLEILKVAY